MLLSADLTLPLLKAYVLLQVWAQSGGLLQPSIVRVGSCICLQT